MIFLAVLEFYLKKSAIFFIDNGKKSHNYRFAHCSQNIQQSIPANSSWMYPIVHNNQEYDSKIQNYKTKQDNPRYNLKRYSFIFMLLILNI